MKNSITIMTICFLSFLFLTSTNAQNTLGNFAPVGISPTTSFTPYWNLDVHADPLGDINIGGANNVNNRTAAPCCCMVARLNILELHSKE